MAVDMIRVVLSDDHAVVRAGLRAVLSDARDITIVGEAANGRDAVTMVEELRPDVLITDLSMPELDGAATTKEIAARFPETRVLVLTMQAEAGEVVPIMEAGAAGYLVKTDADRALENAIRAVAHGDPHGHPAPARALAKKTTPKPTVRSEREGYQRLTEREREVLRLVGQGYSAPEIGSRLEISPKTVDTYKQRIQEKLNLSHRSHYVQFVLKLGLLAQD